MLLTAQGEAQGHTYNPSSQVARLSVCCLCLYCSKYVLGSRHGDLKMTDIWNALALDVYDSQIFYSRPTSLWELARAQCVLY